MKKWGLRIGLALLVFAVLAFVFRAKISNALVKSQIGPKNEFASYTPPPAPDYTTNEGWAALPETKDGADFVPDGLEARYSVSDIAVFFIHPTTYYSKDGWNAPVDEAESRLRIDDLVMRAQASTFNYCCDVYAPRYRQATLWSYWVLESSGREALDFAYADVERAFDEFLHRIGDRPFILAGHSQGGHHLKKLLVERISGTDLHKRMVAAYPIGIAIDPVSYAQKAPDIPACATPTQTGCYVTWNSRGPKAKIWADMPGATCVNPLSWTTDHIKVSADQNPGTLAVSKVDRFEKGVTSAQCLDDRLLVGKFRSDMFDGLKLSWGRDNYHVLDYSLFYASIRQNAMDRATAYTANSAP
ncbi:MAG TPA: DUF3089 domain-containing protein [Hellea balneolensis]|uniref:DUF3089 domain-containing protein n=1 Tax=Hellea balneolensis TaxID=287478 RepID=A0A7C3C661_9PROT|nr:DUF3089 domain-containing protein [Hellea balneolensis]